MSLIQFFHQGVEYTTRHELALQYPHVSYNRMQRLLERKDVVFVQYKNTFYFEKLSIEQFIETQVPDSAPLTDEQVLDRAHAKLAALGEASPPAPADTLEATASPDTDDFWKVVSSGYLLTAIRQGPRSDFPAGLFPC